MEIPATKETDPRKILIEVDRAIRPPPAAMSSSNTAASSRMAILSYYDKLSHAAKALDVEFELRPPERADGFVEFLNELDTKMDKLKIDVMIEGARVHNSIALDGPWRDKIHTYVVVIKQIVESAMDLPVQIRETILKRLQEFDAEVSRTRTRVQVFTDVFVSLCEELNAGAVALTPAVRLGERIIGALARLQGEPPVLSLPAPEEFNLPPPDVIEPSPDHQLSGPHSSSGSTQ